MQRERAGERSFCLVGSGTAGYYCRREEGERKLPFCTVLPLLSPTRCGVATGTHITTITTSALPPRPSYRTTNLPSHHHHHKRYTVIHPALLNLRHTNSPSPSPPVTVSLSAPASSTLPPPPPPYFPPPPRSKH